MSSPIGIPNAGQCRVNHGPLKNRIRHMKVQKKQRNYGPNMEKIIVGKNYIF